jgi:hypothetical protein
MMQILMQYRLLFAFLGEFQSALLPKPGARKPPLSTVQLTPDL